MKLLTRRKLILFSAISLALLVIVILVISATSQFQSSSNYKVAASISPVADIVSQVAGDQVQVVTVLPSGASPHTYEPSISEIESLQGSELMFAIGLELDDWSADIVDATQVRIVDLSGSVGLLAGEAHHHEHEGEEEDHAEDEEVADPHYWLSVSNAQLIAEKAAAEILSVWPELEASVQSNLDQYSQQLQDLQDEIDQVATELDGGEIVTFHSAFQYLADDLGIEIAATVEPFPGQEPSISYLAEVAATVNEHGLTAIFKEPQLSDAVVESLANDYGLQVYTLDPLGGVEGRNSYIEMIRFNVTNIKSALSQ